ncbi:uncharacterized protein A4U43_C03F21010 [Asparagus officinalis]|uniref:Uncharacterized protein n=1 Tax=Asparagus officinalis TaxID=4686 RepID=A0A5P1FGW7_ASPOF|nr:uncharacterized protein A4U43_C03F21010 [Asparagus officinalis]
MGSSSSAGGGGGAPDIPGGLLQLHSRSVPTAARFLTPRAFGPQTSTSAPFDGLSSTPGPSSSPFCTPPLRPLAPLGAELDGPIKHEIHGKVAALRCIDGHMLGLYEPA